MSFEEASPDSGGSRSKKRLIIIASAIAAVAIAGALVWIFWPKAPEAAPVNQPATNQPAPANGNAPAATPGTNAPASNTPGTNAPAAPAPIQPVPAGIDRPVTAAEREKYGLSPNDDIWVKTTSPTDGSQPQMYFYNKSVNKNPTPYIPPAPYKK